MTNPVCPQDSPWVKSCTNIWEQTILKYGEPRTYGPGCIIYSQGEVSRGFYYLQQGRVKISIYRKDGGEKILAIHHAPATFGETAAFDGGPQFTTATTLEPCRIYLFPQKIFLDLFRQRPELATDLVRSIGRKMRLLALQVEDLTFLDSSSRIAHMLLKLAHDYGKHTPEGIVITLPITHQELADVVGVSRVTATTILNRLEQMGILKKKRCQILLKDERRLAAMTHEGTDGVKQGTYRRHGDQA